jgi:tetratricopeptide (TPR) repeat protein
VVRRPKPCVHRFWRCLLTKLARAITISIACTFGLTNLFGTATDSQARAVSGVVETLDGKALPAVAVRLTNCGSATTSESGEFSIPLSARLQPGDPIEISLGENWVVVSPWDGRAFAPVSFAETLRLQVTHRGNSQLLTAPQFMKRIVASAASRLSSRLGSSTDPDELLAEEAQRLGFSVDQIKSAIDEWSKSIQKPYEKGLAELYARHYAEASRYLRESVSTPDNDQVEKYVALFDAEFQLGRYPEAEAALVSARMIEPNDPLVLLYLGQALEEQGKYKEGEEVTQLALAIDERAFGSEHAQVASLLNNLALLYDDEARCAEAEPLYRRALQMDEKLLGPDHRDVATDLNNLAALYVNEGKYVEAEPLYKRAIAIGETTLGASHPDVATRLSNLAILFSRAGRYAEAEPLYKRALAIDEEKLGPEHPLVATTLNNLGSLYWETKRYAEAEPVDRRALRMWEKTLGPNHPKVGLSLNNLATLYDDEGRYAEAEPLFKRSLEITEKALGPEHPDVAIRLNNLGMLYDHEKRFDEAEVLFRRALAINEKVAGSDSEAYALNLHNLGVMYTDKGKPEQAVSMYEQALTIDERALGHDHPSVAGDLTALAVALRRLGRISEADLCEQQAARIQDKAGHEPAEPAYRRE